MPRITDRYQLDPYTKITDVWILNGNFQKLCLIDDYTSLIWSRRYYEVGDFELYVRVTEKNLKYLNVDLSSTTRFIMRNDTKEVMRIEKIEISVNAEEGDFITVSGRDLRQLLYQRCTTIPNDYGTTIESPINSEIQNSNAVKIVDVIYDLISKNVVNPQTPAMKIDTTQFPFFQIVYELDEKRHIPFSALGRKPSINASTSAMTIDRGENVGEKIEELCNDFKIGWKAEWNGSSIVFSCYEGANRTSSVIFSEEFANLISFTNTEDLEDFYNTMILINTSENDDGTESTSTTTFGEHSGFTRFEKVFTGNEDMNVSEITKLRDLLYAYKLPSSYKVEYVWYEFDHNEGGSDGTDFYIFHNYGSDTPNPQDIPEGEETGRTGNDYMSDDGKIIITAYKYSPRSWWGDEVWTIKVSFLEYAFRIYSDEWLNELQIATDYSGHIEERNGIRYYVVTASEDKTGLLDVGTGEIRDKYWPWNNDIGDFDYPWSLTIPAEYAEDGQEHVITIADGLVTSSPANEYQKLVPFSFDITLSSLFLRDRYMAKAYSMVEEALSTNEFEGEIAPDVNYEYRKDYDIGDKIRIKTDIGIDKDVRILEAVETFDSDGYNIEVKFGV